MHSTRPHSVDGAQRILAIVALLVGMTSIQGGASIAKHLFPSVGAVGVTVLRLTFAAIILNIARRPWRQRLTRAFLRPVLCYGAALALMNFCFYLAIERIPLGVAVTLEFTGPLAVSLMTSRRAIDFVWAGLACSGIILMSPLVAGAHELDPVGCLLALAAAVGWALYIIYGHQAGTGGDAGLVTTLGMTTAALLVLPTAAFADARILDVSLWPMAVAVAVLSSALPYSLEMVALKRLKPQPFGVLMSMEPAIGAVMGTVFLHELLQATQWVAIGCVICASVGSTLTQQSSKGAALAT